MPLSKALHLPSPLPSLPSFLTLDADQSPELAGDRQTFRARCGDKNNANANPKEKSLQTIEIGHQMDLEPDLAKYPT